MKKSAESKKVLGESYPSISGILTIEPSEGSTIDEIQTINNRLSKRIEELSQLLHKDMSYIEGYRDGVSEAIVFLNELLYKASKSSEE